MYKINMQSNEIKPLEKKYFSSLGISERDNLQEWIAKQSDVLGEELLIIQKEFSGFGGTRERLDLLALDKEGALVIIENKLNDSGKDVTWQALRYASYCSRLSKKNITRIYQQYLDKKKPGTTAEKAEESISNFMDDQNFEKIVLNEGMSQRIILIAANFRKEVTSAVLWLMNANVHLQCFRATPFAMGEELFLKVEQIIPIQNAEDYMIGIAEKEQEETEQKQRNRLCREFWTRLIRAMNETQSTLYHNITPRVRTWTSADSGVDDVGFNFSATKNHGRAELYIKDCDREENKFILDQLRSQKEQIETTFGSPLEWGLHGKQGYMIKAEMEGNVFRREEWQEMTEFMTDAMCRLEKAIKEPLLEADEKIKEEIKKGATEP